MNLIDYVIQYDKDISNIECLSKYYGIELKQYVQTTYCPTVFNCLKNTPYKLPYKKYKDGCKYDGRTFDSKCLECWNREVL